MHFSLLCENVCPLTSQNNGSVEGVRHAARVGNFYVNRTMIGATVGTQPFGGEGLSGAGPKAGGPFYVRRFATERVAAINTTAAGSNASLLTAAVFQTDVSSDADFVEASR